MIPFSLLRKHFDYGKNKIQIFNCLAFPICYIESKVTVGSEDPLKKKNKTKQKNKKFMSIFVQKGSSGTCFNHGQLGIKTFPIYALPLPTRFPPTSCKFNLLPSIVIFLLLQAW